MATITTQSKHSFGRIAANANKVIDNATLKLRKHEQAADKFAELQSLIAELTSNDGFLLGQSRTTIEKRVSKVLKTLSDPLDIAIVERSLLDIEGLLTPKDALAVATKIAEREAELDSIAELFRTVPIFTTRDKETNTITVDASATWKMLETELAEGNQETFGLVVIQLAKILTAVQLKTMSRGGLRKSSTVAKNDTDASRGKNAILKADEVRAAKVVSNPYRIIQDENGNETSRIRLEKAREIFRKPHEMGTKIFTGGVWQSAQMKEELQCVTIVSILEQLNLKTIEMKWDEENERICLEGDGIRKVFSSVRNFFRRSTQAAFDAEYLEAMENKTYTPELFTVADIEEFAATLPIKLLPVWEQRILLESKEVAINGGNQNGKSGQLFIWKEVAPTASKIAIALGISVKTVEKHLAEIKKLWKAWKASQQV